MHLLPVGIATTKKASSPPITLISIYIQVLRLDHERKIKNENEITTIQERYHKQAGREETANAGTPGCHWPRRQGSGCFCARRESRWDADPWPGRARLP